MGADCDASGHLTDRCRQGSRQQVDCSHFSCVMDGRGRKKKTTSAVINLSAAGVQRQGLIKGNKDAVCVGAEVF